MKSSIFSLTIVSLLLCTACDDRSDEWISLFDGHSLEGWKASENEASWKVEDGAIVTAGPRSHLFYDGKVNGHRFRNFELSLEVLTTKGSNSGVYVHTAFQQDGWPAKGYECQILNTMLPAQEGAYVEHKMTGSLYAIRNVWKQVVPDNTWFNFRIRVEGKTIRTYINGILAADYTEPEEAWRPGGFEGRLLGEGTFALQCHDPSSEVRFRDIKVKVLPDDLASPGTAPSDLDFEKQLLTLSAANFPLVDLHTHLKGGLKEEEALANARKYGYTYGIAVNAGLKMGFESDAELEAYLAEVDPSPLAWHAMQAEGREWLELFSEENVARFDYVFTDALTWTNRNGTRQRLWIPEETEVGDPEDFMEQLVAAIEAVLQEPVDIYVNPTFLPPELEDRYEELWTEERMDRVIAAVLANDVAMEINNRFLLPGPAFIKRAKEAGVKFSFGTNNGAADDLGRMDYAIEMIGYAGLEPDDMWLPGE
ncbi:MAG: hypothetical protein CSA96_06960 [Bacteroidetes bacterium]|nr:MAG: hypothetical protein CSA96_06960 [Bacteroidota bacterium]